MSHHAGGSLRRLLLIAALLSTPVAPGQATPPPAPWVAADFGLFEAPGVADVNAGGFWTLRAFHGTTSPGLEAHFFVYQPLIGDGSVLALLTGQEGGEPEYGRAGIMIHEEMAVRARSALLHMTSGHGLAFSYRPRDYRPLVTEIGERRYAPRRFPVWLRLQREGDQFTPFLSEDGFGWTQLRSPLVIRNYATRVLAGLTAASAWGGPVTGVFHSPIVQSGLLSPIVQVCAGNGTVFLTWPRVRNALGYRVRRSAPDTPGFAADLITPDPIKETSFLDTGLPHRTPVRYLVSALYRSGSQTVEGWPTAVVATPLAVPGDLLGCDLSLEAPRLQGDITFDPATAHYRISGAGAGFGGEEDHGYFASRLVEGDFQVTVRILERPAGAAGLMLRESLEGASRMSFLGGVTGSGLQYQFRPVVGESARVRPDPILAEGRFSSSLYLRLVRRGNRITPFFSRNGSTFAPADRPTVFDPPLPANLYVGYAITSLDPGSTTANAFSDLTIDSP